MDVSIIIPYYNNGLYLRDALYSITVFKKYPQYQYEVIIINDGSTDAESIKLLDELKNENYIIINQQNKGAAAARNAGLKIARGKCLLFLDSDNKLREAFITKGLPVLENNNADIVYGRPNFFGASSQPLFEPGAFHLPTLMVENYIDVCSLVKREVYNAIGGFDEAPELNQEDWEYWIRAAKAGFKFGFIDDLFYDYRVHDKSTTNAINDDTYHAARRYIYSKYPDLVIDSYFYVTAQFQNYRRDKKRPFRSFLKYFNNNYLKKNDPGVR
jgi:glycosyltransferase involved in cell wall biosynthesis